MRLLAPLLFACAAVIAPAAQAATPRDLLTMAAFQTSDHGAALAQVGQALAGADQMLAANPRDHEGLLDHAMAIGYRAKLTRAASDAKLARRLFEQLIAGNPRDPEFQLALGGWHLDAVEGGFFAATILGAKRDIGLASMDRAVALGGDRAFFKAFAAMTRIRLDPGDVATARALAEAAAAAPAPTLLDRIGKRDAAAMLIPLRAGDGKASQQLARMLLPFGKLSR